MFSSFLAPKGEALYAIGNADEFAMQYGLWFSGVPFFIVFFVMLTFTFLIIHSLVLMKQKRDRWSLSGGNDSSVCFRCLASVVTFPAKVKKLFERNSIDVAKSSLVDSSAAQASATSRLQHSSPHVAMRTVPNNKNAFSCHSPSNDIEIKIKKEYVGKVSFEKEETKVSSTFSIYDEEIQLCPEVTSKIYITASRTGNTSDPYAFDLKKIRRSTTTQTSIWIKKEIRTWQRKSHLLYIDSLLFEPQPTHPSAEKKKQSNTL
ncbi:predicted protein [Chaetoceros tenuissimus]|uniref:Uncharacterized protein n=1 Tax=Chaetoceros tenuissimus TaxID=426638 RepID=A0AAD3D5K6_9STRA|nr:predicted protein [Chaetoceros tenuissimus]